MSVITTPHLNFRGAAREALEFYHSVFGGDLLIVSNQDVGSVERPEEAQQVKFGQVIAESGFRIMAYDVPSSLAYDRGNRSVFVSVRGDSVEEITELWTRLVEGATVIEPLAPSLFAAAYGMAEDSYGVTWVLDAVSAG